MCIFSMPPTHYMSDKERKELWIKLIESNLVIPKEGEKLNPNKPNLRLLDHYLMMRKYTNVFTPQVIPIDEEFEKVCAGYKQEWEAHKPNIINTSKTFTVKDK